MACAVLAAAEGRSTSGAGAGQAAPVRTIEPPAIPPRPEGKLKSFFWKKITAYALFNQPAVSFWEQRPELIPLDFDAVGELFRAKLAAKKKGGAAAAAAPAGGRLAVIDMKRATSVGVIMSKLSVAHSRLGKAVLELDPAVRPSPAFHSQSAITCLPDVAPRPGLRVRPWAVPLCPT